jgi:6-phosphogluconate dehydrogenase
MARRLQRGGHEVVVHDRKADRAQALASEGCSTAGSVGELTHELETPRVIWLQVPAEEVDDLLKQLIDYLAAGDIVIDGSDSHYRETTRRSEEMRLRLLHYIDVGVSGGVHGLDRGFALMAGGGDEVVAYIDSVLQTLAPGADAVGRTSGRSGDHSAAEKGYLHCGPNGAGHFVKMVHNGVGYAFMAALGEGLNLLHSAGQPADGAPSDGSLDPLWDLPVADIAEVWRRGSVLSSWLLDLAAAALLDDPELGDFDGNVADQSAGRWASTTAIARGIPAPVLTAALIERFSSRGHSAFGDKAVSAMRKQFGDLDEVAG